MKKIMILGASILQVPALKKAKELGLYVIAVDMNPDAVGFEYADLPLVISTLDTENVLAAAKMHGIDGILTIASDMPMNTVALVAEKLNLYGISVDTARKATNKIEMRQALEKHNVPIPKFFRVSNIDDFKDCLKRLHFPIIVKPADNSGSRGVCKLESLDDLNIAEAAYRYSCKSSRNGDVIVEEFMVGKEVSVETLTVGGECCVIQITDKITTGAPHFVEMGHSQPTIHSEEMIEKIKKVAIDANKAIGITCGPSHTEIMITEEGPKVVELGARLGGDCITTHLVPLSTGVDMVENCIKIALGEKVDIEKKYAKASAIRFLESKPGIIKEISGIDDAWKTKNVKEINIGYSVGDVVSNITCSNDRLGFVIAQSDSVNLAVDACEQAASKIKFSIV